MPSSPSVIDRIYEAAIIPELWEGTCGVLAGEVKAFSAAIFTVSPDQSYRWISTANARALFEEFSASELRFQNVRPMRTLAMAPGIFTRDTDIMTAEELENDPVFRAFIYPNGLKWTAGCAIQEPSGHALIFDITKTDTSDPFSDRDMARLNRLKPDLARAALMSSRLSFQHAQTVTSALSLVGLPAVVIGDSGQAVAMNAEMEAMAPQISTGAADKLLIARPAALAMMEEALARLKSGNAPSVQSIPIAAEEGRPATILHVLPVRRMARDVFSRSLAVIIATTVGEVGPPDMRVLSGLFDLTPGEARLAREIASGATLETAAITLKLSIHTVRSYLKQVMAKTGTRRQAELTALLSGLGPRGPMSM
ncbi:helix-turn-helix transcriptional regulator [Rhizobium sp. KVB221]|uniref:Helix-turn-helix transcriptional regulator n=1 Tax=Rhizobium setariae TaxID=2801340 RepID=A0A936YR59_9HYPH|nr:helix-turn-helix transcriptional regulator [Rhizobium setariae]MBL0371052.1 helix-turn-helix transcriptional regulator [Rhizobium setariae]